MPEQKFRITATTMYGLEEVLAAELRSLGLHNIETANRAVHATADTSQMYTCNLHLRTALLVLKPIASFRAPHPEGLYRYAIKMNWEQYLHPDQTFAIDAVTHSPYFRHSHYAALKLKDAIADHFMREHSKRPSVDVERPDVRLHLHIDHDRITIALNSSGDALNRRGYRTAGGDAPLNEVLAAGMIHLAGWHGQCDLHNPMCGSGTLAIEAALMATRTATGLLRKQFGFMSWPDFDKECWQQLVAAAKQNIVKPAVRIQANDIDQKAIRTAEQNIEAAGMSKTIALSRADFMTLAPDVPQGTVLLNPPYGERLQLADVFKLYNDIGSRLKHHWQGCEAWLLTSNKEALKHVGLRPARKIKLMNGPLECWWNQYNLYSGSRKLLHQKTVSP